jgi:hypothetical protein
VYAAYLGAPEIGACETAERKEKHNGAHLQQVAQSVSQYALPTAFHQAGIFVPPAPAPARIIQQSF